MARITPKLMWDDHTKLGTTILSGPIEEPGHPVERLLDARRSKTFRTKSGWDVVADQWDRIDITEGVTGDATAQLTAGNYATGALMAAEVASSINAVATDNTWTCTYDAVTQKFTIGHDNVETGGLEFATGANAFRTSALMLGYTVTDKTGGTSYVSQNPVLHGPDTVTFDFGVARDVQFGGILTSANAAATVFLHASTVATFASTPVTIALLGGDASDIGKRVFYLSTIQSYRYWRFIFLDTAPDQSFSEFGAVFLGPLSTFSRAYALNTAHPRQELSDVEFGDFGAVFTDIKPSRRRFSYVFNEHTEADHDEWELFANSRRVGGHLWYGADPLNSAVAKTRYGYLDTPGIGFTHIRSDVSVSAPPTSSWTVTFPFSEAVS